MEPAHDQRSRQNEAGADLNRKRLGSRAVGGTAGAVPNNHCLTSCPRTLRLIFASSGLLSGLSLQESFMSQHRSLKGASTITTKRNVLKRFERVELLKKRGLFKPGDKVIGLPKTKPEA